MSRKALGTIMIAVVLCLLAAFAAPRLLQFPVIGTVCGAEHEFIEIDGAVYVHTTERPYTSNDRGNYLGSVKNEDITMRVYDVKGDESGQWLFASWEWEGYFYLRVDGVQQR